MPAKLSAPLVLLALALGTLSIGPSAATAQPAPYAPASFAVGTTTLKLVDASRTIRRHGKSVPRTLTTVLRYPAVGPPSAGDVPHAVPDRAAGPFPLIVFAHGFDVTPLVYARLLHTWAAAGYVVAAPVFPGESATAPGGADEADLVNEPGDISFVITQLLSLAATPAGTLSGLVAPAQIAVAGQSDGGEAALAVAYSRRLRDRRIGAAVVLSGAEMSGIGPFAFAGGPPLLAAQGTADTTNEPRFTYAFFRAARRPKYLLRLLGAEHLPPYTRQQPQLGVVERVTVAFLDGYLKRLPEALAALSRLASVPGVAALSAQP